MVEQHIKKDGMVTVIISAYGRPEVLNLSLQSVYRQSYKKWKVVIIVDCCDEYFIDKVDQSHSNVRIINLPIRCGNQYGPNSVGIHITNTEYIAFLNHDDIWLADHLEIAIETLKRSSADLFLGKSAMCFSLYQEKFIEEHGRLFFSELNQPTAIWRSIKGPNDIFEPVSSWVIRTESAKHIGYWESPEQLQNTPLMEWLVRAAQKGIKFSYSDIISCLKFNLSHRQKFSRIKILYDQKRLYRFIILRKINEMRLFLKRTILYYYFHTIKSRILSIKNKSNKNEPFYNNLDNTKYVEYFNSLSPKKIRDFVYEDIKFHKINKLPTPNGLRIYSATDREDKCIIRKYNKLINNSKSEVRRKYNSSLSQFNFKKLIFDRTGEIFDRFIEPSDLIQELEELEII